jgi:hypothetical protein
MSKELFMNIEQESSDDHYILNGKVNFKYLEKIFGVATMLATIPQIYKIAKSRMAKDFSMWFIGGMIIINLLFFIVGFINSHSGLMLGSVFFILYNITVIYYYFFGIQYNIKNI